MIAAMEWAVVERDKRWTTDREFAATSVELAHAGILTAMRIAGAKNVGKALHIRRPWDPEPKRIGFSEYVEALEGGVNDGG